MGVGKSTIGKKLAKRLGYTFIDLDDVFELKYKLSVNTFFNKYGENLFRELESKILEATISMDKTIISTGGGTPVYYNGIDLINKNGTSVYLKMSLNNLVKRLMEAKKPRPLVQDKSHDELSEVVKVLMEKRQNTYEKANIIFDANKPDIEQLVKLLITHG